MLERLHKVLAHAGFGSRRYCEQLIAAGCVWVDSKPVTTMGFKVDPERNVIHCNGQRVRSSPKKVYLMLHKPKRVLCTSHDPEGRKTVFDLVGPQRERLFAAGRLDAESEGLVILTNDGELCQRLSHPRYQVPRTYHVVVEGDLTAEILEKIQKGVWLSEGKTGRVKVLIKKREREQTIMEVTLFEGLNREVRRIFAKFNLKVRHLKRIKWGSLELGRLGKDRWRALTPEEVQCLKEERRTS